MTSSRFPLYILAHNIRSLHNVGSIFRTADSAGVTKVFLTGYTGTPPDPKIAKVALGAETFVSWEKQLRPSYAIKKLQKQHPDLAVMALENNIKAGQKLVSLYDVRLAAPTVLIIGEETKGIPKSLLNMAGTILEIPMRGQKESLNVSVAMGIASYFLLRD
jgi:tRNA G18 (ribose-2'-O)-methylase SpoU